MIVLNFHRVEPFTGFEMTRLSPRRFLSVLELLNESGNICRLGEQAPTDGSGILITFDDGLASIGQHALASLQSRGWLAVVFLITDFVGCDDDWDVRLLGPRRPMLGWDEVRRWAQDGFVMGSHTCSHRDLTALSAGRLRRELSESKAEIEDRLGTPVRFVSYPFGRHNQRVREAAAEVGYEAAFAVTGTPGDRFAIPRANVHPLMTNAELRRILQGQRPTFRTRVFTALSAGSATVGNWRGMMGQSEGMGARSCAPTGETK